MDLCTVTTVAVYESFVTQVTLGFLEITFDCTSNDHLYWVQDRNLADPYHHQTAHHTKYSRSVFSAGTALKFLISLETVREGNLIVHAITTSSVVVIPKF